MNQIQKLKISTPGRICLFGEHQDYLLLPVIPAAISLRISIEGERRKDAEITLKLPDINSGIRFPITKNIEYVLDRDYFRSVFNVLQKKGFTFSSGLNGIVKGTIPISSGTSSSSALVVSWTNFLARMSDQAKDLSAGEIARIAHRAEVLEFGEPGGMMDQYSTALGGIIHLSFYPVISIKPINVKMGDYVLGDSKSPKDTKSILSRVKNRIIQIVQKLSIHYPEFSLQSIQLLELDRFRKELNNDEMELLEGTIRNRDITIEALKLLETFPLDGKKLGALLNDHQQILRDVLQISTEKIDRMLDAAMEAGAYGGKINGSGGGGCMFVYAPKNTEVIAEAIKRAGGKAYIVRVDEGTRVDQMIE
ncbi:MAG: GHMP kinase [Ignavibacteriales bacterium]|nr:GHMP kinase [Ignavibacteriales bacterium]